MLFPQVIKSLLVCCLATYCGTMHMAIILCSQANSLGKVGDLSSLVEATWLTDCMSSLAHHDNQERHKNGWLEKERVTP